MADNKFDTPKAALINIIKDTYQASRRTRKKQQKKIG